MSAMAAMAMEDQRDATTQEREVKQVQVSLAEFRDLAINQVTKAVREKEEGSLLFAKGHVTEAEDRYCQALLLLDAAKSVDAVKRKDFRDIYNRIETIELLCHLNLAACALNEKRYEDALDEAKQALGIDQRNVKAMYRAGKALFGMSNFREAIDVLREAQKLSPSDKHVVSLLSRARKSAKEVSKSQESVFGGMFSKSSYIMDRSKEERKESTQKREERGSIVRKLRQCIQSSSEVSLLDRWVQNGIVSCSDDEVNALRKVAQRAAASGKLDQAHERDLVSRHGLAIRSEEKDVLTGKEREKAEEQKELFRVQVLTKKIQEGHAVSTEEAEFLQSFRRKEILRLEKQLQASGLEERDLGLLEGLRKQVKRYDTAAMDYENRSEEVETLLKQIESGRRIPIRQRLRMDGLLNEERMRLEQKDDDQGLTSTEWKLLRQIQERQEKQKKEENTRRDKLEQREQLLNQLAGK